MRAEPIPWGAMLRAALRLGPTPGAFWALSLKEWIWLSQSPETPGQLDRQGAAALRARLRDFDKGDPSDGGQS
ncbi:MAG: phage tail assembly chaperone [Hyphomonadaceae bacterium]|nr:phage tail assembly chaperone [Hyphomonadaceae bacterium]